MSESESKTVTYIQTSEHAMIGDSAPLAPGERIPFNEESASHKEVKRLIEAEDPSVAHLSLVEVDHKAEKAQAEEREEQAAKAAEIAAEVRNKEAQEASERLDEIAEAAEGQTPHEGETDLPPQDEEAVAIAKKSGAGQRASTQEDVADEDKKDSPKRGRRKSSSEGEQE